ncbi:MAG: beta-galactosidase, partial [Armatimonadota bacterium]|nr:beta-galactosidase [Armatimonadota bacterium]
VDYYPEHEEESRWATDARLMREAGIRVVRLAEFSWCWLEPEEGKYDFGWLDRAIDTLYQEGIEVILGTPTATPPAWLHQRYDIYPRDARRYPLGFGTRLQRCLNHPVMRRYSRLITEKMVSHYAKHPAVIGWQTDNEFEANLCYCDVCADLFRQWLQRKYGSLEALNRAWGTIFWSQEYSNWSQIPLPWVARCGQSHNPSLWLDYRRFASESTVSFQREQVEIIRQLAPHQFVTHNFMGLHDSMDYFELAKDLDFVSWDNYPAGDWQHPGQADLAHDVMRGIKGKNFWVMEEQSGIIGWERVSRRPAPGQVRAWAWQAIAHGADTVIFFRWRSCLYGTEQYWHGILNHDGVPRRAYREVARLGEEIQRLSAELDGTTLHHQVAILNSYEQNWALQIQPQVNGLGWWEQVRRCYRSLRRLGAGVDIIPIDADLSRYRLLVAPSWYILTEADARRLSEYVQSGGTLVLHPRTGVKDERNVCRAEPLPSLLREVAGVEVDDYDPLGDAQNRVRLHTGEEFSVSVWADALLLKGAEAIATYTHSLFTGEPAIARHHWGQGTVYTLGTYGEPALYDTLFSRMLDEAGVETMAGMPEGVDACWREKEGARYLIAVNLTGEEKSVPVPDASTPLLGNAPQHGIVSLPPYEVGVYKVQQ